MVFKKGQSGNPLGKSKQQVQAEQILQRALWKAAPIAGEILPDFMTAGTAESWNAVRFVFEKLLGKAKEEIDVTTAGESLNPVNRPPRAEGLDVAAVTAWVKALREING